MCHVKWPVCVRVVGFGWVYLVRNVTVNSRTSNISHANVSRWGYCVQQSLVYFGLLLYCACARHMAFCVALLFSPLKMKCKTEKGYNHGTAKNLYATTEWISMFAQFILAHCKSTIAHQWPQRWWHCTHTRPCAHHPTYLFRLEIYLFFILFPIKIWIVSRSKRRLQCAKATVMYR